MERGKTDRLQERYTVATVPPFPAEAIRPAELALPPGFETEGGTQADGRTSGLTSARDLAAGLGQDRPQTFQKPEEGID